MDRKLQQIKNTPYFTYLFLAIQTAVFILAFLFPRLQLELEEQSLAHQSLIFKNIGALLLLFLFTMD